MVNIDAKSEIGQSTTEALSLKKSNNPPERTRVYKGGTVSVFVDRRELLVPPPVDVSYETVQVNYII